MKSFALKVILGTDGILLRMARAQGPRRYACLPSWILPESTLLVGGLTHENLTSVAACGKI